MNYKWKLLTWIPAIIIMVIIFHFSASTGVQSSGISLELTQEIVNMVTGITSIDLSWEETATIMDIIHTPIRKLGHLMEYAALGFCLCLPYYFYHRKRGRNLCICSEVTALIYAAFDEFHQLFVAERSGNLIDVLIDSIGAAFGILFFCLIITLFLRIRLKKITKLS